jgi:hypothetical protein
MREIVLTITDKLTEIKLDYLRSIGVNIGELIEQAIINYEVKSKDVA